MNAQSALDLIRRYYAGCNAADRAAMQATFCADVVHYFTHHAPVRGAPALAEHWARMQPRIAGHWTVDHGIAQGDEAVIEWTLRWTPPGGAQVVAGRALVDLPFQRADDALELARVQPHAEAGVAILHRHAGVAVLQRVQRAVAGGAAAAARRVAELLRVRPQLHPEHGEIGIGRVARRRQRVRLEPQATALWAARHRHALQLGPRQGNGTARTFDRHAGYSLRHHSASTG